ncbi:MAG: ATP-binding protein [Rhodoferax sp.]
MFDLAAKLLDENPVPMFAIDINHQVTHLNKACAYLLKIKADDVLWTRTMGQVIYGDDRPVMADLIVENAMEAILDDLYQNRYRRSLTVPDAYEAEGFFPNLGSNGLWLFFTAAPIRDEHGRLVGAIETLQDISQRKIAENALMVAQLEVEQLVEERTAELARVNQTLLEDVERRTRAEQTLTERNTELQQLNVKLASAQEQLVQSEKLASIGQLAAGVAHEINNPIGYIFSNFGTLEKYLEDLFEVLRAYEQSENAIGDAAARSQLASLKAANDLEFLLEDIPTLMHESKEGIVRVRKIVQDLKDFSHVDATKEWQFADLNKGIDSTLNIVNNEVKYKADIVREYGEIPEVQCMASQVNQVIMNLVVNAAHAMGDTRGKITVRTGSEGQNAWFEVADNGSGIPKDVLPRIFDPFFTTKPVGKGTGLGLSLSYGIVQKHHGKIDVSTETGKGTTFRVTLPLVQADAPQAPGAGQ